MMILVLRFYKFVLVDLFG